MCSREISRYFLYARLQANPAPSDKRLKTARVVRGHSPGDPREKRTVANLVESVCSETAKIPSRPTQLKNVHVHDGGVVATVDNIPKAVDWLSIKKALDEKLGDLPSPVEGNAVTFATKVDPHSRSCFVLFKPFDVDEEFFRHMNFKVDANSATSSPNFMVASSSQAELEGDHSPEDDSTVPFYELQTVPLYGIDLQEALKKLPAHVLRKRESRAKAQRLKRNEQTSILSDCTSTPSKASRRTRII
ncbi:hypothetical protein FOZ63_012015 [Perkinsus olseni]|uniref:Uncharacterized protein n=1 Tax=Perkinsus olseni TaxID=32597 RepID=A0A7J6Q4C3_PEROL|nr:hypothetical protein FOZ63_012015 [Perkinsus olseni]